MHELKNILSQVPEISFRSIPDPDGDSCTFLSWFLPTEEITRAVVNEMKAQGILAGNFYWYDNNWHYIRKWDHLKNAVTLNALHPELKARCFAEIAIAGFFCQRCYHEPLHFIFHQFVMDRRADKRKR